jgi:hypothetical protein
VFRSREKNSSACSRRLLVVLSLGGLLLPILAATGAAALADEAMSAEPSYKALLIDWQTVSGRIESLGPGVVRLVSSDGAKHVLPLDRLIKLTREDTVPAPAPDAPQVIFPDGDRITKVSIESSNETSLEVQSDVLGKVLIPLDSILGLIFAGETPAGKLDLLCEQIRFEPRTAEVVWLANGDRISGGFLGLDDTKIKIQVAGKPMEVDRAGVVALGFDPKLVAYPRPKADFFELSFRDGSKLAVRDARIEESSLVATTRFGTVIKIPSRELVQLSARTAGLVYLSERKPIRAQYLSYVGPTREYRLDRTVDGQLFRMGGQSYDRGLGMQSTTFLAYRVEPGDDLFQALVGVDERAGPLGSVVFRVLVDGKEQFKTPALTDHDSPRQINVKLTGAKYFILATEFGDRGNVRDLADWVEARIIRKNVDLGRGSSAPEP